MAQFQFRLATLLRLREATRDKRRLDLAEVQRKDAELQRQQQEVARRQDRLRQDRREAAGPGEVNVPRLVEAEQYAATLRSRETELAARRREAADEIQRRRQTLIEADRDVRSLEKLRENQRDAHRQEEHRQDGKRLDEAALQTIAAKRPLKA